MKTPEVAVEAIYVGCWQQVGHYTWFPGMVRAAYSDDTNAGPWGYNGLDDNRLPTRHWVHEQFEGWTAIGREDWTVDARPGSHSVFAFKGDLTLEEAIERARATFPEVFARMEAAGGPLHTAGAGHE